MAAGGSRRRTAWSLCFPREEEREREREGRVRIPIDRVVYQGGCDRGEDSHCHAVQLVGPRERPRERSEERRLVRHGERQGVPVASLDDLEDEREVGHLVGGQGVRLIGLIGHRRRLNFLLSGPSDYEEWRLGRSIGSVPGCVTADDD